MHILLYFIFYSLYLILYSFYFMYTSLVLYFSIFALSMERTRLSFHCWLYNLCIVVYVTNKTWNLKLETWCLRWIAGSWRLIVRLAGVHSSDYWILIVIFFLPCALQRCMYYCTLVRSFLFWWRQSANVRWVAWCRGEVIRTLPLFPSYYVTAGATLWFNIYSWWDGLHVISAGVFHHTQAFYIIQIRVIHLSNLERLYVHSQ